jgi:hypothetical protein
MEVLQMKHRAWYWLGTLLSLALGFAGGAEYVMQRVEKVEAQRRVREQEIFVQRGQAEAERDRIIGNLQAASDALASLNIECQAKFSEGTLVYETPAVAQVSLGLRSVLGMPVNLTPGANGAPRWWIPAKIKPQVYGEARGAVYYYVSRDQRVDGPYFPEGVTGK